MSVNLEGKTALVTGAGTGIGRGIALKLAASGVQVAVHYSSSVDGARETVQLIEKSGGHALPFQANLERTTEAIALVEKVIGALGKLDILVNNAAVSTEKMFFDVTEAIWDQTVDLNLKSAYFCAQAAARAMSRLGSGKIIFIGSIHGNLTSPSFGVYAASKGGINMMTRQLAVELAPMKINVNCVAPGVIEVERYYKQFPWYKREDTAKNVPWGRVGFPEDVANLVAFLASDEADFITGQIIYVDGGQTAKLALHRPDLEDY